MRKLLPAILLMVTASLTSKADTGSSKADISRNLQIFNAVYKTLQTNYVDTIDANETMKNSINAMLYYIDPYNEFYPEDSQEELLSLSTGEFGGIGSYIQQDRKGRTIISKPQPGTPSYEAGMLPGDIILTVDSDTVLTLGSNKVRERLRGKAGSTVDITVQRPYPAPGSDSILSFSITRAAIPINPLTYYGVVRDTLGFISLSEYSEQAPELVKNALIELRKDPRVKAIVLDLRGNGGGLLESAVKIVSLFVDRGTEVVRTRGRGQSNERIYRTTTNPIDTTIPLAVLIDDATASSSEITAGALQDLDRAVIIGERSYGKGLVQSTFRTPSNGLLKVTTARYYIPSGRLIQAIDYSHRNPDGSVSRMPDSLTRVFHTRAGREVRDGGGITPDIAVEIPVPSRLTYNVISENRHFDFATLFKHLNPDLTLDPFTYSLPDSVYEQFKEFVIADNPEYDKFYESYIDNLRTALKREGYDTDEVNARLDDLIELLHHDLATDLDINREAIQNYVAGEILDRYDRNGNYIYNLRHDPYIDAALKILTSPDELRETLSAPK